MVRVIKDSEPQDRASGKWSLTQILHLILANPVIMSISRTYTFTSLDPRCAPDARKNEVATTQLYREVH